ncbi:NifB/NifX family molybdenum-iron cluster-binding protein [Prolixibacteraceae bacterium]|nr:NifB/NifX family molybdenum-iron cluster-binding protein [Prolixibacteraceae bacterium]
MKIVVPASKNNTIDHHFGHCHTFKVFVIGRNMQIEEIIEVESPEGCGCKSNIATTLKEMNVELMLAGNMGNGAINKLSNAGIKIIKGCEGDIQKCVEDYLAGSLHFVDIECDHHDCTHH